MNNKTEHTLSPTKTATSRILGISALFALAAGPRLVHACACGCGVFEVGTSSMLPRGPGGTVYLEYDYQNQNINWHGNAPAPRPDNNDKEIRTSFLTAGVQFMFNQSWGIQAEVPYDFRHFQTANDDTGVIDTLNWSALGDIRLQGIYTGFFPDMSAGLTFGVKVPTGDFTHNNSEGDADRDSEIGTGSTDALLGGFLRHALAADNSWTAFGQFLFDVPLVGQDHYLPGTEVDAAAGVYFNGINVGPVRITPIAQVIGSFRAQDSGDNAANPVASGYERILLSPGLEFEFHSVMFYVDAEVPVYEHTTGDQLVAPVLFKIIMSYEF
jgi:hypothetical protein